jgi:hypothetical protein
VPLGAARETTAEPPTGDAAVADGAAARKDADAGVAEGACRHPRLGTHAKGGASKPLRVLDGVAAATAAVADLRTTAI